MSIETKLIIKVKVRKNDVSLHLFGMSKRFTDLGFQPLKDEILRIDPVDESDMSQINDAFQINIPSSYLFKVYERIFDYDTGTLEILCAF